MKKLNIPINKGNYNMESPERQILFQKHLSEGWEDKYKEYRANWIKYAKEKIVSEYPLLVDIELSTINLPRSCVLNVVFLWKEGELMNE